MELTQKINCYICGKVTEVFCRPLEEDERLICEDCAPFCLMIEEDHIGELTDE